MNWHLRPGATARQARDQERAAQAATRQALQQEEAAIVDVLKRYQWRDAGSSRNSLTIKAIRAFALGNNIALQGSKRDELSRQLCSAVNSRPHNHPWSAPVMRAPRAVPVLPGPA